MPMPNDDKRTTVRGLGRKRDRRLRARMAAELPIKVLCGGCHRMVELTENLECPVCGRQYITEAIQ